ncbi:Acetyl esterase/lipase [Mucilaginibacter pineti]|uniref:alpha-L-rhamnosidase n=1 Tax=Mucilaginibacter pineti TaxID=1391627 RepID=A0A1G7IHI9_9SPHI|nr:family 78 glycoside hydrolase catalytic domain [Mucilaginibacter pineti]SDF12201.1 Acetyl esterase/lipase [Mucilaginibacter pineti]
MNSKAFHIILLLCLLFAGTGVLAQKTKKGSSEGAYLRNEKIGNWQAKWIQIGFAEDTLERPAQYFQKTFAASGKIRSAKLFVTAHGLYEAKLNGKRIGDAYLTPGWTDYAKRLQYQAYDVTPMLNKGTNTLTIAVGDGWFRGYVGFDGMKDIYGKQTGLLAQLELTYSDGKSEIIPTDESWKSGNGPIRTSSINNGETLDSRIAVNCGQPVKVVAYSNNNLVPSESYAVSKHETFKPLRSLTTPKGEKVLDFGQNLVGWVVVRLKGKAGDKISIEHAEVLDKAGNFYTANLRNAQATATYILSGNGTGADGKESLEPHFTYFGFRYIKVSGTEGEINPDDFTAVALYSDMRPTGNFSCSNPLINQLQHNIQWGQRGNFLDIPTDCPQRDERLGWTGDAQAFFKTAAYNFDVKSFFSKWMKDVASNQSENGSVTSVVPDILGAFGGSAGWADVATIIPWQLYEIYGDRSLLDSQYAMMKKWVDYVQGQSKDGLWQSGFHFGDWLSFRPGNDDGTEAITDKYEIAQCFWAHSTQNLINAARTLGKGEDVVKYTDMLSRIKKAYLNEYVTASGRLLSNTQTAYVLALHFDMLPENMRARTARYLVDNIKVYKDHLSTGFLGTPYICHVLSRFGYPDVAFTLLNQDTFPSWLYPVKMGATTIWERWDGIRPDGSFQTPQMNSFNHYAYGAIGDWMYQNVLGIQASSPGYKTIRIKPLIGGGLTWAKGSYECVYGKIGAYWKLSGSAIELEVEIPEGTTAEVWVPGSETPKSVGPGRHRFSGSYFGQLRKVPLYGENKIPFARSITENPALTVFPPVRENKKGIAVIVCSGGSYGGRANEVEGIPACKKLAASGITAFLLDYRVPDPQRMEHKEMVPLTDAQRAIQYVREHAKEFDIDPARLGIMGFSAGGHLASTVGTHFKKTELDNPNGTSLRPDFMVLVYPVISFSDSLTHESSRYNLIGPDLSAEEIREFSNELQVSGDTPPTFLVHGRNDSGVKFANSEVFYGALKKQGVKAEFLRYDKGEHGFGAYNKDSKINWMDECIKWIYADRSANSL